MFEVDGIRYVPVSPSERTCDAIDCVYDSTSINIKLSSEVSYKGITMTVKKVAPYICHNNKYVENLNCEIEADVAEYAFSGCTNLNGVVCYNQGAIGNSAFSGCTNIENFVCENKGEIGEYAFSGCSSMKSVTLGEGVSAIGNYSFQSCKSLQAVVIPDSVTQLGAYSFSGCTELKDMTIGNQVRTIGQYALANCKSLSSVKIPNSVKTIGDYALKGCTGLKTLIIANREDELSLGSNGSSPLFSSCPLDSVYIGGNITYNTSSSYGYSPFYRNTTLRTVVFTDRETEISPYEFYGCTNLQNFTVGDGVTKFGDWAFSGCSNLKNLIFGSQLQTIGKEAFSDCSAVTTIVSKAATPPACGTQSLDDINKWNCTLYVPEGCMAKYQAAGQWKDFFFMQEGAGSGESPVIPESKKCATPTIVYENGVLKFGCETEGVTFVPKVRIVSENQGNLNGDELPLNIVTTCTISVYATKEDYENSETVTKTITLSNGGAGGNPSISDVTRMIERYLNR